MNGHKTKTLTRTRGHRNTAGGPIDFHSGDVTTPRPEIPLLRRRIPGTLIATPSDSPVTGHSSSRRLNDSEHVPSNASLHSSRPNKTKMMAAIKVIARRDAKSQEQRWHVAFVIVSSSASFARRTAVPMNQLVAVEPKCTVRSELIDLRREYSNETNIRQQ